MPTVLHINKLLTNISIAYTNEGNYIADKIFPNVPVKKDSDLYAIYDHPFRTADDHYADGAPATMVRPEATSASYIVGDYALASKITPKDERNSDLPMQLEKIATENLTEMIDINKERRAAELLFTNTSWTNSATLSAGYNDYTADVADPVAAVDTGAVTVLKNSGREPNMMVIGRDVMTHMKNNYRVIDRLKYTQSAVPTPSIMASMFEVEKLYVGKAAVDTGNEYTTTSGGFIWGDDIWLGWVARSPGLKVPSALYKLSSGGGRQVRKWMEDAPAGGGATVVEVADHYALVNPATSAGYLIKDSDASG